MHYKKTDIVWWKKLGRVLLCIIQKSPYKCKTIIFPSWFFLDSQILQNFTRIKFYFGGGGNKHSGNFGGPWVPKPKHGRFPPSLEGGIKIKNRPSTPHFSPWLTSSPLLSSERSPWLLFSSECSFGKRVVWQALLWWWLLLWWLLHCFSPIGHFFLNNLLFYFLPHWFSVRVRVCICVWKFVFGGFSIYV